MSDTDDSFNFLISMCYTQLFNLLCEKADDVYGGRLPVHVRCLIDEAANIGQIPRLEKLVATIRSREISACLVLQAQSQLKAIYKDNADTIIGNMDTSIFLGGKEPTTLKELAAVLGKETIDTYNTGESRGRETSHSLNDNPETVRCGYALNSHPAVLDGFIDLVREEQQHSRTQGEKLQPSRPSVRDKLKQELPAHKPAAPKKREPER